MAIEAFKKQPGAIARSRIELQGTSPNNQGARKEGCPGMVLEDTGPFGMHPGECGLAAQWLLGEVKTTAWS
jgi:hypothetical protein